MDRVLKIAKKARESTKFISNAGTGVKNKILSDISRHIVSGVEEIIRENEKDMDASRREGISESLIDRLKFDRERIEKKAESIDKVIKFNDPVGEVIFGYNLPNGLILKNIRVPLGVIGIIYEARPEVTIDASVLCLKAGNSVILRGSSHAINTNKKLVELMGRALRENNMPESIIQIIPTMDKKDAVRLMQLRKHIDVLIPRGGKSLIESVVENSKIPVIETGIGNCHIYIDDKIEDIDAELIANIVINAKVQRPSVCNAAEKLLVHRGAAQKILHFVLRKLEDENVKLLGCPWTMEIFPSIELASEEDWYEEYLDYRMAVKVVNNIEEAVAHINKYGSHHTETIITSSYKSSRYFTREVDSAVVFVNASTRFTDGEQFGMGTEIGISTQRLHWRGPMGLRELTTNKFVVYGSGQIRE
jgi:glutamate-5-semialdehyde dehydrogenase